MKTGIELIAGERQRQVEKLGYDAVNDSAYKTSAMGNAAVCYTVIAGSSPEIRHAFRDAATDGVAPAGWPWHVSLWKPGKGDTDAERVRELAKAGALIAAEIDRIQRKKH